MKRAVLSRFRESRPLHSTDSASLNSVIYSTRDSDTSPTWKNCPNLEAHLCSYPCAWNYQKRFIVYGERRRFLSRSMVVLFKIEGNFPCLRARSAHMVGNLPTPSPSVLCTRSPAPGDNQRGDRPKRKDKQWPRMVCGPLPNE